MADKTISQLTGATTPLAGTEVLPIVQSNATKKVSVANLTAGRAVSAASVAATGALTGASVTATGALVAGNSIYSLINIDTGNIFGGRTLYRGTPDGSGFYHGKVAVTRDATTWTYGSQIDFYTEGKHTANSTDSSTLKMTIDSNGNIKSALGNFVIGTSGKGIDFSAAGNATGMTSELLADYEEGTFTPALSFGGGTTGITYSVQVGSYTKIGNRVSITIQLILTSKGSSTGIARISTPFAVANNSNARGGMALGYVSGVTYAGGQLYAESFPNTSEIRPGYFASNGSNDNLYDTNFSDSSIFMLSGQYYTA